MYLQPLKIEHPFAKWVFSSLVTVILGLYLIVTGVSVQAAEQGVFLTLDLQAWVGVCLYVFGILLFVYLMMAPRIKNAPAADSEMNKLEEFIKLYPEISNEMGLNSACPTSCTYGELKAIQKSANRLLAKQAKRQVKKAAKNLNRNRARKL